jgi:tetratricopeptide (TPR) repeat protein
METTSFLIWLVFIALIFSIGVGAMLRAYQGSGGFTVLFAEPIALSSDTVLEPDMLLQFQKACDVYRQGSFPQAIERFTRLIQDHPTLAEAYHNRGLSSANLRQADQAVSDLLQAGEQYLEQGHPAGFDRVKQDLATLKQQGKA